jgi:hypothetical protein
MIWFVFKPTKSMRAGISYLNILRTFKDSAFNMVKIGIAVPSVKLSIASTLIIVEGWSVFYPP